VLTDGAWSSPSWAAATAAIVVASPLDRRLDARTRDAAHACHCRHAYGRVDRDGGGARVHRRRAATATDTEHRRARGRADAGNGSVVDARGEGAGVSRRGFVVAESRRGIGTRHCAFDCERSRRVSPRARRDVGRNGTVESLSSAVRHYVFAEDDAHAAQQFAQLVARLRGNRDQRTLRAVLAELVGERLPESRVRQLLRGVPSIIMAIDEADVRSPRAPTYMRVHVVQGRSQIIAGDSVPIQQGIAAFNTLRFRGEDPVTVFRFEAPGYRPTDVAVKRMDDSVSTFNRVTTSLALAGGSLQGQSLNTKAPMMIVAPRAFISGFLQVQYSTAWPAASVWLSMTPTWGNHRAEARELQPMMTPVQHEVLDVQVSVFAPSIPGHYWLLYIMNAEPSGLYAASRTNWTVGHSVWDDGNDLAALPDSIIRDANRTGFIWTPVAFPATWPTGGQRCTIRKSSPVGEMLQYCEHLGAMFGIEVIVR
jgi:hypothetical protein